MFVLRLKTMFVKRDGKCLKMTEKKCDKPESQGLGNCEAKGCYSAGRWGVWEKRWRTAKRNQGLWEAQGWRHIHSNRRLESLPNTHTHTHTHTHTRLESFPNNPSPTHTHTHTHTHPHIHTQRQQRGGSEDSASHHQRFGFRRSRTYLSS